MLADSHTHCANSYSRVPRLSGPGRPANCVRSKSRHVGFWDSAAAAAARRAAGPLGRAIQSLQGRSAEPGPLRYRLLSHIPRHFYYYYPWNCMAGCSSSRVFYETGSKSSALWVTGTKSSALFLMGTKSSALLVLCTLAAELRNGGRHPFGDCTLRMELRDSHISHSLSSILYVQYSTVPMPSS